VHYQSDTVTTVVSVFIRTNEHRQRNRMTPRSKVTSSSA